MADIPAQVADLPEYIIRTLSTYQNKMARYLFEISHLDGLDELRSSRALPIQLMTYYRKVTSLFDQSTQTLLGQLRRRGLAVGCRPGCAHCCYHMPKGVSTLELIAIYQGMSRSGILSKFFRRCLAAEEMWDQVSMRHSGDEPTVPAQEGLQVQRLKKYQESQQPCPFLDSSICRIYPYRPFACRMHFSVSPAHWCHPSHFQNAYAVRFNFEPGECVFDALDKLDKRFQLRLSDVMVCGLLDLTVNVMQFEEVHWLH